MAKKSSKESLEKKVEPTEIIENDADENLAENELEQEVEQPETVENEKQQEQTIDYTQKYNELNDRYLRLSAEYDNFRKRSLKEKMELIKTAGEDILLNILPVIDNFERALKSINNYTSEEGKAISEGVELIYGKFKEFLQQRGVKEIEAIGKPLDTEFHEAITKVPVQDDEMKGKIIDVVEKGYLLHEKVIRFSKVVIGE